MGEVNMSFKIEGDSEGYVTFECPFCSSEFKLQADELQSEDNPVIEIYCPYCGLTDEVTSFYTQEVRVHIEKLIENFVIEQVNQTFGKMARSMNNTKHIKMTFKPLKKVTLNTLKEHDTVEQEFECKYCQRHQKVLYCAGVSKVFCSYCGVDF